MNPTSAKVFKYRKSKQRDKIMELLKCSKNHPTAEWIYNQLKNDLPHLSLGTVYRNIRILKKMKLIKELEFGNSLNRYDGNPIHHYHFICKSCDCISDIVIPELQSLNANIEKTYHFKIDSHRLEFWGICSKCIKENSPKE